MPGYVSDGKPLEEPDEAYAQNIGNIKPSFGESFGSMWEQGPTAMWMRASERGANSDASFLDQALWHIGKRPFDLPDVSEQLSATEANAKYAPPGTKITDKPVSDGLAKTLGEQKRQQIQREGVLTRYSANASWPEQLGMGIAATLLDPISLATSFVPGVGEETLLARVGFGSLEAAPFGARLVARGVSGFSGGAAAQAPVSLLKYNLSQEEHDDYSLMSAFGDMAVAGGLNAAFHAGFGSLGDLFKVRGARAASVDPSMDAPLQTRQAAMNSAVAQMVDGREVDTTPVFSASEAAQRSNLASEFAVIQQRLKDPTLSPEMKDALQARQSVVEEEIKARAEVEAPAQAALGGAAPPPNFEKAIGGKTKVPPLDRFSGSWIAVNKETGKAVAEIYEHANAERVNTDKYTLLTAYDYLTSLNKPLNPSDLAAEQAALYKNGFAQGIPQAEFDQASAAIYGEPGAAEPPQPKAQPANTAGEAAAKPQTPAQTRLADLEAQWAGVEEHTPLSQAERDELDISKRAVATAESRADALDQAATCLKEAGI